MNNKEAFDALKPNIVEEKKVLIPGIPVDVFNQEAENLHYWALDDKDRLIGRGLTEEMILCLLPRTKACRHAQGLWFKERHAKQEAQLEWSEKAPGGYELRDGLIDEFEFAFHQYPALLARVDEAKKGNGHADMIQDLTDLALLGKDNVPLLTATNCDVTILDTALNLSDELARILAIANGEKAEDSSAKLLRDKAYTYLKEAVDEVRRVGRFVFKNEKARLVGYQHNYSNSHR
ncbi:hypothetical protein DMA11_17365 [Marinilabiliaceae bacterium JC017]|nr:hypothetical protein DMA11_17365 [Marinilabiliaceae bacterium JC017]